MRNLRAGPFGCGPPTAMTGAAGTRIVEAALSRSCIPFGLPSPSPCATLTRRGDVRLAGIIISISLVMLIADSEARDRGQFSKSTPEMKKWFDGLKSEIGSCCSDADGTALSDVDWESKNGKYRVRLNGQWIDVPDNALIRVPNLIGRTIVWPMPQIEGDTIKIRCFMPGTMI
jgi:hypothetical protein